MRCDATSNEIEAFVLEGKRLRLGISSANVGEPALGCFAFHHVEHFLGDVCRPHARNMRGECIRDVAAAGGDVQCAPGLLRGGKGDKSFQALSGRVWFAGEVVRGSFAELLLDSCFGHRSHSGVGDLGTI